MRKRGDTSWWKRPIEDEGFATSDIDTQTEQGDRVAAAFEVENDWDIYFPPPRHSEVESWRQLFINDRCIQGGWTLTDHKGEWKEAA